MEEDQKRGRKRLEICCKKRNSTGLSLTKYCLLGGLIIVTDLVAIGITLPMSGLAASVEIIAFLQFREFLRSSVLLEGPISIVAVVRSICIQTYWGFA